ncbi:M48 family metallopeptidase [Hydrogenophaga sp.]|uniref:M48 family metallopeptidase n=1 Tax=Hydrogenophaga sp. TaxID=1904254 RepID=UPI0027194087|nr:SprT family zinc-dependent metalloprotease [Hydrogenophaga sp.]MDO9435730.1 SprT family zinc-dependent metalloprotease [Hydrogenophaga sp.]
MDADARQYAIVYGDERIPFSLRLLPRPQRRVAIHVMPDGAVRVDAPEGTALPEVKQALRKRAGWVWQQLQALRARMQHVLPRAYVSGETHFYLGRRHLLKVQPARGETPGVRLWRGRLEISTDARDAATVRRLLERWYRARAEEVFARVMADMSPRMGLRGAPSPLRLLSMKTQWGSCSPRGEVLLNPHLVKAPRACIEYVVAHELCHLKEHNHSERFYRLLARAVPDWAARKAELDGLAELLLNR